MTQYLLSVIQPDGNPPPKEFLDKVMQEVGLIIADMKSKNVWVFNAALHDAHTATLVRVKGDEVLITDGPYVEAKEHIGGIMVLKAPDLDDALEWARRMAKAITLPIEVRPFREGAGS